MNTGRTILLTIGLVLNGVMLCAALHTSPTPHWMQVSSGLCLPQVQMSMASPRMKITTFPYKPISVGKVTIWQTGSNGLLVQQVKVDLPSKHVAVPIVPYVFSPNTQRKTDGGSDFSSFTVSLGLRNQQSYSGSAGDGVASTSFSSGSDRIGGPQKMHTRSTLSKWHTGLGGWFDENYNFQPNNEGGIPQAPYLTSDDSGLTQNQAVPVTRVPYVLMVLMAGGYAIVRRRRLKETH